jgi:cysteine desulfuration protein SufE
MAQPEFDDLAETFDFLDDWEDRYRHVIEMGRDLAADGGRAEGAGQQGRRLRQPGLVLPADRGRGAEARFDFPGRFSDAMIVRGLIAVLHALYAGRPVVSEVPEVDAPAELARLGLDDHLSSQRSNGVRAMVGRLRARRRRILTARHA